MQWYTNGAIVEAERGRALAFDVKLAGFQIARRAYRFEPDATGPGCTVTEEWTDRRSAAYRNVTSVYTTVRDRPTHNRAGMERALAQLNAAAQARG